MKYANYEETTGKLLGWYDSEIHGTYVPEVPEVLDVDGAVKTASIAAYYDASSIPTPNIEVSEVDWQTALDNGYNYVDATTNTLSTKDFRTFTELQVVKKQEIKASYNSANQLDIDYMSTTFQADKASQDLITGILAGGAVPSGFTWRDNTQPANVDVPMTLAEFQGLSQAIVARGQVNWIKYQGLKAQVDLATTQADLDLIVW